MLTKILVFLSEISPWARRVLWRWWYDRLARRLVTDRWTFMNYGLMWPESEEPVRLEPEDESDRYCVQLYHRVATPGRLSGMEVLEVGSGRGGGAAFVARHHTPARIIGVDFSPNAVALCQQRHREGNLRFEVGDAERLPFGDGSFDAVLNVESSHCYGSMASFVGEVVRVLRPGGVFLMADLRGAKEMTELEALLRAQPSLEVVEREDLTPMVVAALQADHERKRALIAEAIPHREQARFREFAGLTGSQVHCAFVGRTMLYHRFMLRRVHAIQSGTAMDDSHQDARP